MTNETTISIKTASVVINANLEIKYPLNKVANSIAKPDTAINITNSIYHTCLPGLKTNVRFIIQQKILDTTNPNPVAQANRHALRLSDISATGSDNTFAAKSSALRHFKTVDARK